MSFTVQRRWLAAWTLPAVLALSLVAGSAAEAQRRRQQEPPPAPEPLPEISGAAARCSFAFHDAMTPLRNDRTTALARFDGTARLTEPGLAGRWLFWNKAGKGQQKAAATEQVCAETAVRAGRQRCVRWETKKIELPPAGSQPAADELAVLRALDAFVGDRGAALEFGSNGRQHATLQRFVVEISAYVSQPRHPALCNGVSQMMDFHAGNLAGVKKRSDDVVATAAKAASLARLRVIAAREQRVAEAKAAASAPVAGVPPTEGGQAPPSPTTPPKVIDLAPVPPGLTAAALLPLAVEGLLPGDRIKALEGEGGVLKRLHKVRELLSPETEPALSPAARAAAVGALRMVEAAAYSELQVARVKQFADLFLGTVDDIRGAHADHCTCGE